MAVAMLSARGAPGETRMTDQELELLTAFHRQAVETASNYSPDNDRAYQKWRTAKRVVWMVLLALAFLFFYLISKMHEALAIL
jgi:hypothetical protein